MTALIEWMLITAEPEIAEYAQRSGVHRIFVDMEVMGKAERQGHLDTHMASHTHADISAVRSVLRRSELMVRLNPLHAGTAGEVDQSVACGADRLMLPMFTTPEEVRTFRHLVPDETPITFLAETPGALARLEAWLPHLHPGDEVHFGLNDLSIAMGLDFLFEPVAAGLLDYAAALLREAGVAFGIGGVARPNGGKLPAHVVIGEHVRLGSTRVILSRAFHGCASSLEELTSSLDLPSELSQLRAIEHEWRTTRHRELAENHRELVTTTFSIAERLRIGSDEQPPNAGAEAVLAHVGDR